MMDFEWPASLTRDGDTITRDEMEAAFASWDYETGCSGLAARIGIEAGREAKTRHYQWHRHADAMIQRARIAGLIRLGVGRKWERA